MTTRETQEENARMRLVRVITCGAMIIVVVRVLDVVIAVPFSYVNYVMKNVE